MSRACEDAEVPPRVRARASGNSAARRALSAHDLYLRRRPTAGSPPPPIRSGAGQSRQQTCMFRAGRREEPGALASPPPPRSRAPAQSVSGRRGGEDTIAQCTRGLRTGAQVRAKQKAHPRAQWRRRGHEHWSFRRSACVPCFCLIRALCLFLVCRLLSPCPPSCAQPFLRERTVKTGGPQGALRFSA